MSAEFGAVSWQELLPLIGILALSGVFAGFVAGLLGVGGGIVTVPVLAGVFGSMALLIAAKMLLPLDEVRVANDAPRGAGGALLAGLIGAVSAIMGIGGGTLTVPTLNLCGYPIHRAVGTASLFGIFIAIPGTLGYLLARPPVELPWATVGFVSLVGLAVIAPGSMLTARLGARVAHSLSRRRLSQAFGVFLLVVGARMLYRALA